MKKKNDPVKTYAFLITLGIILALVLVTYNYPQYIPGSEAITVYSIATETIWENSTVWENSTIWINETIFEYATYYGWPTDYGNATSENYTVVTLYWAFIPGPPPDAYAWNIMYYDHDVSRVEQYDTTSKTTFISTLSSFYSLGYMSLDQYNCALDQIDIIDP